MARQEVGTNGGHGGHGGYHHKISDPGPRLSQYTKTPGPAPARASVSDIKSAQKEAVISYMDRVNGPRAGSALVQGRLRR